MDGGLAEEGYFTAGKRSGIVYRYDKERRLKSAVEYVLFSDSPEGYYANQKYYFEANGDTIKQTSNYYSLHGRDTIYQGEMYELTVSIDAPIFSLSGFTICNYDSLFHLKAPVCDTIRMKNHIGTFKTSSYDLGLNVIRGMIYDYEEIVDTSDQPSTAGHEFYFKKEFYVKPR